MKYACDVVEIKKEMATQNISTIGELSSLSTISRNTLGKILNAQEQPSAAVMYKLVDALNLSPEKAGSIFFKHNLR